MWDFESANRIRATSGLLKVPMSLEAQVWSFERAGRLGATSGLLHEGSCKD